MLNAKSVILAILNVIDYQDDRNKFAIEFINLCCGEALNNCLALLSEEKRDLLNKELLGVKGLDSTVEHVLTYISKDVYQKQLEIASRDTLVDFINTILPTIAPAQEEKLRKYLNDLGKAIV